MSVTIVYPFPLNGFIPGGQVTVERAERDTPYPPPVPGDINVPMSPMTYAMLRNVPNLNYSAGGGGGVTPYQQTGILAGGSDTIVITANAGVLPIADASIILFLPQGPQPQTEYTIDRVSNPDEIVLDSAVIDDTPYCVLFWIPA